MPEPTPIEVNPVLRMFRGMASVFGPRAISCLVTLLVFLRWLERRKDFAQFKRLRHAVTPELWRGIPAWKHFIRVLSQQPGPLSTAIFYDQFRSPEWSKRLTTSGPSPETLPEWGKRPVIVVLLHAGGYLVTSYWLRSRGVAAGAYVIVSAFFEVLKNIRAEGDRIYGVEGVPQYFAGSKSFPQMLRFLVPGRALIMALEQVDFTKPRDVYPVNGGTICLSDLAFRLALRSNAILLPVAVHQKGFNRFEFSFGRPVPDELVKEGGLRDVNTHLIGELWSEVEKDPSSLMWVPLEALNPDLIGPRKPWA